MSNGLRPAARPYRMRKRLDDVEETRRRIVEATVELHGSVGPANTTFSGVAARAGVQRSTVYRHFPDEETLFRGCTSHWFAQHPWPRAEEWREEPDAARRLERGLRELYRYYDANEQMMSNTFRDMDVMPPFVGAMMGANIENTYSILMEAWPDRHDHRLQVAVRHALDLRTWQSLASTGTAPDEASRIMAAMVSSLTT